MKPVTAHIHLHVRETNSTCMVEKATVVNADVVERLSVNWRGAIYLKSNHEARNPLFLSLSISTGLEMTPSIDQMPVSTPTMFCAGSITSCFSINYLPIAISRSRGLFWVSLFRSHFSGSLYYLQNAHHDIGPSFRSDSCCSFPLLRSHSSCFDSNLLKIEKQSSLGPVYDYSQHKSLSQLGDFLAEL